jgi:hypothetical protein
MQLINKSLVVVLVFFISVGCGHGKKRNSNSIEQPPPKKDICEAFAEAKVNPWLQADLQKVDSVRKFLVKGSDLGKYTVDEVLEISRKCFKFSSQK